MIAYLSGAMEYAPQEGKLWRDEMTVWLKNHVNHSVVNPVILSQEVAKKENATHFQQWKHTQPEKFKSVLRKIIDTDIHAVISDVDYLICLWDEYVLNGGGTHGEITFAYWHKKPVYLINKLERIELSSWIEACSHTVFKKFDSLKQFLLSEYS